MCLNYGDKWSKVHHHGKPKNTQYCLGEGKALMQALHPTSSLKFPELWTKLVPCLDYKISQRSDQGPNVRRHTSLMAMCLFLTSLALWSAYNLIRICDGDEWKTAFITPVGYYEYLVLPYGLSNSPSVFQAFMNEVFLHRFVIIYIDDIFYLLLELGQTSPSRDVGPPETL